MNVDLSHLHPSVRSVATEPDEVRLRHINTTRWVGYARAHVALNRLEVLLDHPPCARMPCMLIYGLSGIGKTMIIEKFMRDHTPKFDRQAGLEHRPIAAMQMPPAPDEKRFYTKLLASLDAPFNHTARLPILETIAIQILRTVKARMLVIDEVHHLLAGTAREQRRSLNLLKFLANDLQIAVVALGTTDALHALQSDPQIASRFEPFVLQRWQESQEFRSLLASFTRLLPLRKPSTLGDQATSQLLLRRSAGITGRIIWIIRRAAEFAIRRRWETVDFELVDRASQSIDLAPAN